MKLVDDFKLNFRGYLLAAGFISGATALFYPGREYFSKDQWALLYLLIVMFVSTLSGVRAGVFASLLSFLAWNYFFLSPYHTFVVYDPKDWLSLLVFLGVGILIGLQAGRLKEREERALSQERKTALLSHFSARLVKDSSATSVAKLLVGEVQSITGATKVAVFANGPEGIHELASAPEESQIDQQVIDQIRWVCENSQTIGLPTSPSAPGSKTDWRSSVRLAAKATPDTNGVYLPLQTATRQVGALYIKERPNGGPYTPEEAALLVAIANQVSIFLERKQLQLAAFQADVIRETDRLKSTLLSSVSHELKTPLSSISATITNMLEGDLLWSKASVKQELQAVLEDVERLNGSIGSLIDLSRLESAAWHSKRELWPFGEIIGTVLSRIPHQRRKRISFRIPEDLPLIKVDFVQWTRVFYNLIDNALSYGGDGSAVRVGAKYTDRQVVLWVEDEGPGVSLQERDQIFTRFFRGSASPAAPAGTGLGLSIAREIVRFHGGEINVEDAEPSGARFVISLPLEVTRGGLLGQAAESTHRR